MKTLLLLALLASCGKVKVKVETTPTTVAFGPNFEKAIELCDKRYGINTPESEACFIDYREYLSPELSINLKGVTDFCSNIYKTPTDVLGCRKELTELLTTTKPGKLK